MGTIYSCGRLAVHVIRILLKRFHDEPMQHAILDRHDLVARASRTRTRAEGTPLSVGLNPNDLWCTDYKGEFQLGNKHYCYPLTVTDYSSRYLLLCEAMDSSRERDPRMTLNTYMRTLGPEVIQMVNQVTNRILGLAEKGEEAVQ
jgi:hypothetical protein